jgi:RHS repeat-associated protein
LTKVAPTTTATKNLTTTNTYNLAGDLLASTFSDDRAPGVTQRLANEYENPTGRLKSETWWEKFGVTAGLKTGYEYDPVGNRTAIIWPDLYRATYAFDPQDRLVTVGYVQPGGTTGTLATYAPNPQGEIDGITYGNGATATISRLTSGGIRQISFNFGVNGAPSFSYGFSAGNQTNYEQASDGTFAWTPPAPNVGQVFNAATQPSQSTNLYNQYEQATFTTGATPAAVSFTHDGRGNMTANGSQILNYDFENRLERVSTIAGVEVVRYDYDPAGRRSVKTLNGGAKTVFIHAGPVEIADFDASTATILRRFVPGAGLDQWVAFVDEQASGSIKYVHQNKLGSVIALSDPAKVVSASNKFTYDPYGNSSASSAGFPFRFTGQRFDPETGLYYYRARYYDPRIGRFMQSDPIGVEGGANLYAYVQGDPQNLTDPRGTDPKATMRWALAVEPQ